MIIALRTELHDSKEDKESAKAAALGARKRAARAEGQIEELKQQLNEKEAEHDEVVKQASQRIEALEKESESAAQSASDKALILQETIERDRLGHAGLIAERDQFRNEAKEAKENEATVRRELEAIAERHEAETSMITKGKQIAEEKVAALQDEIHYLNGALTKKDDNPSELHQSRGLAKKLQQENTDLKSELASQSKDILLLKGRLAESHNSFTELQLKVEETRKDKAELASLREQVERLRTYKRKSESVVDHVSALAQEKEELSRLISSLSPTGDVQEGLEILRTSNSQNEGSGKLATPEVSTLMKQIRELNVAAEQNNEKVRRQSKKITELTKRLREVEGEVRQVCVERDEALIAGKRHERIRGIIEYEKNFFKQALDKIETEFENPQNSDEYAHRLQKRCDIYEQSCEKYRSTVKDLETSLNESRKKIEELATELVKIPTAIQAQSNIHANDAVSLHRIDKSSASANKDLNTNTQIVAAASKLEVRIKELEAEVQRLRKSQKDEEVDYDPSAVKVVHMKSNPHTQAVEDAAKEREIKAGKKRMRMELGESFPGRGWAVDNRIDLLRDEIQKLEARNEELAKKSKVGIRLGEVAKKKIEEVRAVVYNLFGWSMNVYGAKYRVTSIYAEGPEDVLEFGMNESGTMTLMETDYTSKIAEEIGQYVQKMNSIPALLANITMENFEKTTTFV